VARHGFRFPTGQNPDDNFLPAFLEEFRNLESICDQPRIPRLIDQMQNSHGCSTSQPSGSYLKLSNTEDEANITALTSTSFMQL
jgi:hypothetical protein